MTLPTLHNLFSQPLAMHRRMLPELLTTAKADPKDGAAFGGGDDISADDFVISSGVARVPIHGLMTKRTFWWSSRLTTDRLTEIIRTLADRPDIEHIVLDIDSGGGQVSGTEQLAETIFAARETTNVIAVVNEFAASAALWVAAAADHIVIPPSAEIGSLGVYTLHFNDDDFLKEFGFEKTVIFAGKYKAIHERKLTKDLKQHEQTIIDGLYSQFVDSVAKYRGVSSQHVLDTWADARCFLGTEAVSNGLADELGTLSDVLESVQAGRSGRISLPAIDPIEEPTMSLKFKADGTFVNDKGETVATLAELNISAEMLQQHCKVQVDGIVKAAVDAAVATAVEETKAAATKEATVVIVDRLNQFATALPALPAAELATAVKGERSVAEVKAEYLEGQLKAKDEELKKATAKKPPFAGSGDADTSGDAGDDEAGLRAAFEKNPDGFSTFGAYKAFHAAEARGLTR